MHDEAVIVVKSGNGGPGCASFRREKFVAEGGPDGGDGGDGGDVVLEARENLNTLTPYVRRRKWKAGNGRPGGNRNCNGKGGDELVLLVPCGTIVHLAETGEVIADLTDHEQRVVVAAGGRGGWGNTRFKKATNQVPRQFGPGTPGVEVELKLGLKLIADVGLIGFPNAGKSTLLSRMSEARPKIGAYPFTTLDPQLGVIETPERQVVMADIPGLIEGAAEGVGLGHQFLRHVERCGLLVHLVDGTEGGVVELQQQIAVLNDELRRFSPFLADKRQLVVLNKVDARPDLAELGPALAEALGTDQVLVISGVSGAGIRQLTGRLLELTDPDASMDA